MSHALIGGVGWGKCVSGEIELCCDWNEQVGVCEEEGGGGGKELNIMLILYCVVCN